MENKYNSLENIDVLIERLEENLPTSSINDIRVKKAISKRQQQINELKRIRDEARQQAKVLEELTKIEDENDDIDEVIGELKKLVKVKKEEVNKRYSYNSYNDSQPTYGYFPSESRSSESNYSSYCSNTSRYPCSSESRSSESRW